MRPLLLCVLLALLAPAAARAAGGEVAIFFYPWYGTPADDGSYVHWQQRGHAPPTDIASNYWPERGVYSSSDRRVLASQMREIRDAGISEVVVSWWGKGSPEDARLPEVAAAARAQGLRVAIHLEPYAGRTAQGTLRDVLALRARGFHSFYLYRPGDLPAADWAAMNGALPPDVRVLAQTALVGRALAGGFDGVYTYDIVTYGASKFRRLCTEAHRAGLLCAPSVGPGYDARRGSGDARVKPRRDGATYDAMWGAAIGACPDLVTITSFNEWHEGTQIEPAADHRGYENYDGSWGLTGAAAARSYLDRTRAWTGAYARAAAPARTAGASARQCQRLDDRTVLQPRNDTAADRVQAPVLSKQR